MMYAAVFHFGKRWEYAGAPVHDCDATDMMCFQDPARDRILPEHSEDAFARLQQFIEDHDPSLAEIEAFDHPALEAIRARDVARFGKDYDAVSLGDGRNAGQGDTDQDDPNAGDAKDSDRRQTNP